MQKKVKNLPPRTQTFSSHYLWKNRISRRNRKHECQAKQTNTDRLCLFGMTGSACFFGDMVSCCRVTHLLTPALAQIQRHCITLQKWGFTLTLCPTKLSPITWQKKWVACFMHACIPLKSTGHLPVTNVNLYLGRAPLVLLKNLTSSIRMLLW